MKPHIWYRWGLWGCRSPAYGGYRIGYEHTPYMAWLNWQQTASTAQRATV